MKIKELTTMPRIIGILLIIFAVIAYRLQQTPQAVILVIAAIILLLSPNKNAKQCFRELIESFKLKKEFAVIMFIDAMFWVVLVLLGMGLYAFLKKTAEELGIVQLTTGITPELLASYNDIISSFFTKSIIAIIIFFLLLIVAYAVSRALIWLELLNKQRHMQFLIRFGLINLVWCALWLLLTGFLLVSVRSAAGAYSLIGIMLLYTHLTTILHYSYTKKRAFGIAFKDAFGTGIGSITGFAQQYCYIFIIYILLSQILRFATGKMLLVVSFLLLFVFMAWYRIYMRNVLRRVS